MPTITENLAAYMPRRKPIFQNGQKIAPANTVQPMTAEQFVPFDVEPPSGTKPVTPGEIETPMNDDEKNEIEKRKLRRLGLWLSLLVALLTAAIITPSVVVPILLNQRAQSTPTYALNSVVVITTSTTVITTTVNCVSPYVLSSSGSCVNTLIDIHNCGSVSNNCLSNYTSCSAGVCSTAPGILLLNSNFVWTAAINGSIDDNYFGVTLPFNITLYTTTTSSVYVTTNGVLCLGSCSAVYTETALPTASFPGATVLPYWDDLYIYSGTSQGIYYGTEGNAPNRTLIFEFYMSHYNQQTQYYHYQVLFFEGAPGIVQYKYFDASDGGVTCTVGVQASGSGPFIQYSYDLANSVHSNMSLIFDTNLGIYMNTTI